MKTCEYAGDGNEMVRAHPWVDAENDATCRYYDFTQAPQLIRTSLEDFKAFKDHAFTDEFYAMLLELNQPNNALESNDCAFVGPHANANAMIARSLQSWGRLMILFRHLPHNILLGNTEWIAAELHRYLHRCDTGFLDGMIGTTIVPVHFLALGTGHRQQAGFQLLISFWAWGNSEKKIMKNTHRVITNLSLAIRHLSAVAA